MASPGNEYPITNCAAVILAGGSSSRLGRPKQLLVYQGKTLLQHAIDMARHASVQSIIVVLGSGFELLRNQIDTAELHVVKNDSWQTGIASSITCGITALQRIAPGTDAAILMVCDQPFITSLLLNDLLAAQKAGDKPIVASKYGDTIGIPALFHKSLFTQLLGLEGDSGAKKIMQQYPELLVTIPFPLGNIDIDTLDDYKRLNK
ncbi:MAG: MobA-like protein-like protein [Mucilaginibacter sp.]|nr:MobA-like protein-like protein [Mucilaginibacter sp.]